MIPEQDLKAEKKASGRARKAAPPQAIAAPVATPPIPAPKDAQAYGVYLSFLGLVARTAEQSVHEDIDPDETALLEIVILRWARGAPMTVRQTIAMAHLGSPATLHKRLMRLRAKNYLQLQDVAGDRRVKQLVPGVRGIAYVETMGRHLLDARQVIKKASKAG